MNKSSLIKRIFGGVVLTIIIAIAGIMVATGIGSTSAVEETCKNNTIKSTSYHEDISPERALEEFENTHKKHSSLKGAVDEVPAALKSKVKKPKNELGAELIGVYTSEGNQPAQLTMRYSNNMGIDIIEQANQIDYDAQAQYMKDLDAKSYGSHTTQVFITTVNGYQAMALEKGQNADGSAYGSYVQWSVDGVQYMVSSDTLGVEELLVVACSMY